VFEHASLAGDVKRAGAQVLHSPSIDFATTRPGAPYVMTVHDLVPLKQPGRYLSTGIKHRLRYAAAKRATQLIVPTRAVASDCEQLLGIDPARLSVIAEAAAPVFRPVADPAPLLARLALPEEFVLWVGGLDPPDPRKRVRELATAAARRHGLPLVLAGRLAPESAGLAARGRVLLIGRTSDEELAALYSAATALVVASEDEGFGLPAMEALACETPVAAFAIDSLREQYDGSPDVALVQPGDYIGLLDAAADFAGRRASAPSRSWSDVAAETWTVYERAAGV
jgi:glycosyltransferase involved in cell wall biosynthesis